MVKSDYFYRTALALYKQGDFINSMSRAWYACLHTMRDNLETKTNVTSHKDVINKFVTLNNLSSEFKDLLTSYYVMRERADYQRGDYSLEYYQDLFSSVIIEMLVFVHQQQQGRQQLTKSSVFTKGS